MSETIIADFIKTQPMWLSLLVVFVSMCAVDVCWALYNRRSAFGKGFQAGLFSAGIVTFSLVSNAAVVANNYMLPAAVLAGFLATWLAVDWDHARQRGPSVEERLEWLEERVQCDPTTSGVTSSKTSEALRDLAGTHYEYGLRQWAREASARVSSLGVDLTPKDSEMEFVERRACVPVPCPGCGMSTHDPGFVQEDHVPIRSRCYNPYKPTLCPPKRRRQVPDDDIGSRRGPDAVREEQERRNQQQ